MGHHNIRFDGDEHSLSGAWSPPTSRANFCEEDYVLTFYLAEFINSLTNVAYVYFAIKDMYGPRSRGMWAPTVDFMSFSLLVLGIGSFLFHASLRQTLEFVDELSMLLLVWSMMQSIYTTRQSPGKARVISAFLAVVFISFSIFYVYSAKIIYQVIAFLTSLFFIILRCLYLFHWSEPALPEDKRRNWSWRMYSSMAVSSFGYLIWNIDLEFCAELRNLRQQVGLPWAWLLEFHGWWHVLTAIGASQWMNTARELKEHMSHEKKE